MSREEILAKKVWDILCAPAPDEDEWLIAAVILHSRMPTCLPDTLRSDLARRILERGVDVSQPLDPVFKQQITNFLTP